MLKNTSSLTNKTEIISRHTVSVSEFRATPIARVLTVILAQYYSLFVFLFIFMKRGSSKYDFVKVKVWIGDHYYVLSRFLLARLVTVTMVRIVHVYAQIPVFREYRECTTITIMYLCVLPIDPP